MKFTVLGCLAILASLLLLLSIRSVIYDEFWPALPGPQFGQHQIDHYRHLHWMLLAFYSALAGSLSFVLLRVPRPRSRGISITVLTLLAIYGLSYFYFVCSTWALTRALPARPKQLVDAIYRPIDRTVWLLTDPEDFYHELISGHDTGP
ncbi:MAG: hypothetical protein ABI925_12360 [Verrucomicrobiota bacterium]